MSSSRGRGATTVARHLLGDNENDDQQNNSSCNSTADHTRVGLVFSSGSRSGSAARNGSSPESVELSLVEVVGGGNGGVDFGLINTGVCVEIQHNHGLSGSGCISDGDDGLGEAEPLGKISANCCLLCGGEIGGGLALDDDVTRRNVRNARRNGGVGVGASASGSCCWGSSSRR